MPEIVIIAALAEKNRVIGMDMKLPWRIPEDLKRFKQLTTGHALLMGRRTFESLVQEFGGPLPNRRNVVITTRGPVEGYEHIPTFSSIEEALKDLAGEEKIFIGGGGEIYRAFLKHADRMELTLIEGDFDGDTYFPEYEHLVGPVYEIAEEDRRDGFRFVTYVRKST